MSLDSVYYLLEKRAVGGIQGIPGALLTAGREVLKIKAKQEKADEKASRKATFEQFKQPYDDLKKV